MRRYVCSTFGFPGWLKGAIKKSHGKRPPKMIHPGKLTWNLKITGLKRKIIFQTSIVVLHVNLPGCTYSHFWLRFQSWAAACSLWEKIFDQTLGGGFKYVLFSSLPGEMIQFDEQIFSNGLVQPPTRTSFVFHMPCSILSGEDQGAQYPINIESNWHNKNKAVLKSNSSFIRNQLALTIPIM